MKEKRVLTKPNFWRVLGQKALVAIIIGAVLCGVLTAYINAKCNPYSGEEICSFVAGHIESSVGIAVSDADIYDQISEVPYIYGACVRVYKDDELMAETAPMARIIHNFSPYDDEEETIWYVVSPDDLELLVKEWPYRSSEYEVRDDSTMHFQTPFWGTIFSRFTSNPRGYFYCGTIYKFEFNYNDGTAAISGKSSSNNRHDLDWFDYYCLLFLPYLPEDSQYINSYQFSALGEDGVIHKYVVETTDNIYMSNAFKETGVAMYVLYGIIEVICLIVGIIIAIATYVNRKYIYDIYSYRTSITNKLAHDLKTPLMSISLYADNIKSGDQSKKDYYADKIMEDTSFMNALITNTLLLSKAENGGTQLDIGDVNIKDTVDSILEEFAASFEKKNINVISNIKPETTVKTDKIRFRNAVICLIDNASKYTVVATDIVISSENCVLSITNTYDGEISDVTKLKEAYVRGSKSRSGVPGNGLGLAIADRELLNLGFELDIKIEGNKFTAVIK